MADLLTTAEIIGKLGQLAVSPGPYLSIADAVGSKATQLACNGYSAYPEKFVQSGQQTNPVWDDICKPYFAANGYGGPSAEPPFTGGQCAIYYKVNFTWTYGAEPVRTGFKMNCLGPIQGMSIVNENGNTSAVIQCANGPQVAVLVGGTVNLEASITSVESQSGAPDNCGNPGTTLQPGTAPVYNFNDNSVVSYDNRNYDITLNEPTINNVDKSVTIPILITGGIKLSIGDGSGGSAFESGQAPSVRPPTSGGSEIGQEDLEANDGELPDPPLGKEYAGVYVELIDPPSMDGVVTGFMDKVYPTTIGNARLLYATNGIPRILEINRPIREDAFVLMRPFEKLKVIGCQVSTIYNGSYKVTPLLVDSEVL